jgi:hypothetical protein
MADSSTSSTTPTANGAFYVADDQIIGPSGTPFIAKGINIYDSQMSTGSTSSAGHPLLSDFPGINMVRLAVQDFASVSALSAFITQMTDLHVVVEIEDHSVGGGDDNVLTGSALTNELAWYSNIATAFKSNPYVWFGTMNEPDDTSNEAAVTNQEVAIYDTIRATGNTNPIMMEQIGGYSSTVDGGLTAASYAGMTNIIWDTHYYGWISDYSTHPTTVAADLAAQIANAQSITSANGVVPVIVGEYGICTSGSGAADPNGTQVVSAVEASGYGSLAWAWSAGTDALVSSGGTLTAYGTQVAQFIATPYTARSTPTSTALCFCTGTAISTSAGDIPVEKLAVGDLVLTCTGQVRPIVWIGVGRVMVTRGRRSAATPVIVRKGALADNIPYRDLRVTKGHSLYLDRVLIPVEFLVNHRSIIWDDHAQEEKLYHVELANHDVLLANGAPAESYRDEGNRWLFQNANSGWGLPPKTPYAPVLTEGRVVDAVWRRLLERAGPRPGLALTNDPDLHLLVDGDRLDLTSRHGMNHVFALPARPTAVSIMSRAGAPAEMGLARDPRTLGVAVRRIALRQGTQFRVMEAADALLAEGFYAFEPDNGLRWTDGNAGLPQALFKGFDGPTELVLHVGCTTQYLLIGEMFQAVAA